MEETSPTRVCWAGHSCYGVKDPVEKEERGKELAGSKFSARVSVLNWVRVGLDIDPVYHSLSPANPQVVATAIKRGQTQSQVWWS